MSEMGLWYRNILDTCISEFFCLPRCGFASFNRHLQITSSSYHCQSTKCLKSLLLEHLGKMFQFLHAIASRLAFVQTLWYTHNQGLKIQKGSTSQFLCTLLVGWVLFGARKKMIMGSYPFFKNK